MGDIKYSLIGKTYVYSNEEFEFYREAEVAVQGDWDRQNSVQKSFKSNIKQLYYRDQKERCAFCRKIINLNGHYEHLEHIASKDTYPSWAFHPKNLVVACAPCNGAKWTAETLVAGYNLSEYPIRAIDFVTLNPHFENWHQHLKLKSGLFFIAKTVKGLKTIKAYDLTRGDVMHHHFKFKRISKDSLTKKAAKLAYEVNPNSKTYGFVLDSLNAILDG